MTLQKFSRINLCRLLAICTVGIASCTLPSCETHGALTKYATREAWQAAVGIYSTETFESYAGGPAIPETGGTFFAGPFHIVVDANHGRIGPAGPGFFGFDTPGLTGTFFVGDVHSPESTHPHFNTIRFAIPVWAFAVNFAALDDGGIDDVRVAGESFVISPFGSLGLRSNFFGVVSTTPFSEVDIRNANGKLERFGMDDMSFKVIPEPATGLLLFTGMMGLLRLARLRR
ncbi:PEP-CTERM sorting domain-containing protein [Lacipirellula parvula]|uniref:PEP-CTERM protein-sorting domain-containing protein n=1 Tax=Lacipirellula parvula TaxID=2650471 RepID=A0A5K7X1H1_9BACT|nr:PEP-CTERM sorting domain-containing protein [Lacipirellula parvula]BBO30494.1 hypothetical protein PLANPX_0106 [Lacipirellula parvula]